MIKCENTLIANQRAEIIQKKGINCVVNEFTNTISFKTAEEELMGYAVLQENK